MKTAEQWARELHGQPVELMPEDVGAAIEYLIEKSARIIRAAMREAATEAAREAIVDALENAEVEVDYWIVPQAVQAIVSRVMGEEEGS
jgi:hypothetical protein